MHMHLAQVSSVELKGWGVAAAFILNYIFRASFPKGLFGLEGIEGGWEGLNPPQSSPIPLWRRLIKQALSIAFHILTRDQNQAPFPVNLSSLESTRRMMLTQPSSSMFSPQKGPLRYNDKDILWLRCNMIQGMKFNGNSPKACFLLLGVRTPTCKVCMQWNLISSLMKGASYRTIVSIQLIPHKKMKSLQIL